MNVYITGTTRGLGRALKKEFTKLKMNVVGLDRPDYNLKILDSYVRDDFAIYINNAQHEFSQTELLYKLVEANKHRECHIINIGSVSSDGDRKAVNRYAVYKTALEKACQQLSIINSKCKISLIKPGRMKTNMTDHIDADKMDPREVARTIVWVAMQPKHINIKSMSVDLMQELT